MRYKIKASSRPSFERIKAICSANTHVYVVSDGRLTLSTGDLSDRVKDQLSKAGGTVLPEARYSPD